MADLPHRVAFFDIGNTLASVRVAGDGNSITELAVFQGVPRALTELRKHGVQLGIISDPGHILEENVNRALERAALLQYFNRDLIIYGPKDSSLIFEQAATRARQLLSPESETEPVLLFVGEDANERAFARAAGFRVAPRPHLALTVLSR